MKMGLLVMVMRLPAKKKVNRSPCWKSQQERQDDTERNPPSQGISHIRTYQGAVFRDERRHSKLHIFEADAQVGNVAADERRLASAMARREAQV